MTSIAKIESNRRNAARSTGPRTSVGKARSRQNAIRHHLSRPPVLSGEQTARLKRLVAAIANGSSDPPVIRSATDIAQATMEIETILAARLSSIEEIENPPATPANLDAEAAKAARRKHQANLLTRLEKLDRYLDRAMARRRRALCDLRRIVPYGGCDPTPLPAVPEEIQKQNLMQLSDVGRGTTRDDAYYLTYARILKGLMSK